MGTLKILNGVKLILDDQGNHLDSYTIRLESFRKPVTGQELYLLFLTGFQTFLWHSSLLSIFGLNATSTYDSYLPLIFGKFALI